MRSVCQTIGTEGELVIMSTNAHTAGGRASGLPCLLDLRGVPTADFLRLLARRLRSAGLLAVAMAHAWSLHLSARLAARLRRRTPDAGVTTAEYAVGTVAACGFAALLYKVLTGGAVSSALQALVRKALGVV